MEPFNGNGDVSIWMKNHQHINKHTKNFNSYFYLCLCQLNGSVMLMILLSCDTEKVNFFFKRQSWNSLAMYDFIFINKPVFCNRRRNGSCLVPKRVKFLLSFTWNGWCHVCIPICYHITTLLKVLFQKKRKYSPCISSGK